MSLNNIGNGNGSNLASIPSEQIDLPPAPDPQLDPSGYLRSIYAVRERSRFVMDQALKNNLTNFHVDMTKFPDVARYVVSIIKVHLNTQYRYIYDLVRHLSQAQS